MRWFRNGFGKQQEQRDPARQQALLQDVRNRFGAHRPGRFPDQAAEIVHLLTGDDGLLVAAAVLRESADAAHGELSAQAARVRRYADRINYRPLWRDTGALLRWPLFDLPGGLHPYIQVVAAATVLGAHAKRVVRVTDPYPALAHLFELLDLMIAGWEFGRVRVDADGAVLTQRLINSARALRDAMAEPPPLPPPVRELMRRNNTIPVHDPATGRSLGGINPGRDMREQLLA